MATFSAYVAGSKARYDIEAENWETLLAKWEEGGIVQATRVEVVPNLEAMRADYRETTVALNLDHVHAIEKN